MSSDPLSFVLPPEAITTLIVIGSIVGYAVMGGLTGGLTGGLMARLVGTTRRTFGSGPDTDVPVIMGGLFWPVTGFVVLAIFVTRLVMRKE